MSSPFVNLSSSGNPSPVVPFAEGGPVRLTRFVEMSLDSFYAHLNGMVSSGVFQHIGRASIRVEGTCAWGVWLRIDHWSQRCEIWCISWCICARQTSNKTPEGCSQEVPRRCPVRFCRSHCTSSPMWSTFCEGREPFSRVSQGCSTAVPRACASGFLRIPLFESSLQVASQTPSLFRCRVF